MRIVIGASVLLLAAGCQTSPFHSRASSRSAPRVEEDMLAYVPAAQRSSISEARTERDAMEDRASISERDVEHERETLELVQDELDVADAQVDNAQEALLVARKSNNDLRSDEVEGANQRLTEARSHQRMSQSKVAYQRTYIDQRRSELNLAELRVDLADARVELAKASAIQDLDRPEASTVPVIEFERRVEDLQTEVELASIDLEAWKKKVELRRQGLDSRDQTRTDSIGARD